ncbi:actin-like ATPase domain-containing protein [Hymenopellis radicata]|nr:actin-like ATPase domain-containing protein [Hymenopellis radicata]
MASPTPNGNADAAATIAPIPPVVGINFGNSYASIAVFTKEGLAESIANEDGERQIACAIAFQGEEMYIGNQAKQQLVKNSANTITGFRNLIGKNDEFKVEVLVPAPSPLPSSAPATPRSEPIPTTRVLTVHQVTTIFLKSLIQSAEDFLGKKVQGAVITVPPTFSEAQIDALDKAATEAGVKVYQFLEEAGAVVAATSADGTLHPDRTQLIVDLGSSSLSVFVVSVREGLGHVLGEYSTTDVGADQIDDKLISFFAADFSKKNKIPLTVCPSTETQDKRAEAKLRLAIEHTKRTLSASPGAATCSVESLKDGYDYTGSVNRLRFDMLARPVYTAVASSVTNLLGSLKMDSYEIDEIVYVGGTSCLPGLDEHLVAGFSETVSTPFSMGTVGGGGIGDPTTLLARGCAIQAAMIAQIPHDEDFLKAFERGGDVDAPVLARSLGLYFPQDDAEPLYVPVLLKETLLPARRVVNVDVTLTEASKTFGFELWEVEEGIRIDKVKPPKVEYSDDEEEEEEEEEEIEEKHKEVKKVNLLAAMTGEAVLGIKTKGTGPDKDKWFTTVEALVQVSTGGDLVVQVKEIGEAGAVLSVHLS